MKPIKEYYELAEQISKREGVTVCVGVVRHIDTGDRIFEGVYVPYSDIIRCIDTDRGIDIMLPRCKVYEEYYIAYNAGEIIYPYGNKYGGKNDKNKVQVHQ